MKINTLKFSLLVLFLVSLNSFGQKVHKTSLEEKIRATNSRTPDGHIRCVTPEYEASLQEKNPKRATTAEFENWLSEKIAAAKRTNSTNSTTTVITIPVVVHVINDGDAIGSGENIADAQVRSQITVLNQDYRRMLGTPGYNTNAVGADVEIEFCLAQRDPNGDATDGIDRVNLGTASWTMATIDSTLKPQTVWDSSQYLNLWVCRFGGSDADILGFAQFPNNSGLGGLAVNDGEADTDGVAIGYQYFGSSDIYPGGTYAADYNKGRTATHEVGHYLGLRHIWGDNSSCTTNTADSTKDYCPDTPAASAANYVCATINSCTAAAGDDMIENYMDYTTDVCMNIFTQNQKARMVAVLQNATRRASLLTSLGCTPAETFGLDAKLEITDLNIACSTSFAPTITMTNKGTTDLTSVSFIYSVDNVNVQTYNWSGYLIPGASVGITLDTVSATSGAHTFYVSVSTANGSFDENMVNDYKSKTFTGPSNYEVTQMVFTLQKDYYSSETTWNLKDSSGTVVYSGGPYADSNPNLALPALLTQTFALSANQCYTFTINDAEGDGICCDYGNGYYNIKSGTTVVTSGSDFGETTSAKFTTNSSLGTEFETYLNSITLYPNPATNVLNISIQGDSNLPDAFIIYNSLGQTIQNTKVDSVSNLSVNTSGLSTGVYFIKINKDNESKTLRFIKN